jgi:cell division protein FtsB
MLRKILPIVKNKYLLITIIFVAWVLFFDKNNIISQVDLAKKLQKLQDDKKYYQKEIKEDSIELHELLTDPENLEKFARERYLMKRDSEEIFLIVHKDTLPADEK